MGFFFEGYSLVALAGLVLLVAGTVLAVALYPRRR